ncbi:MAG: extracellular solute-binding protein [Clostridia bacterium]|nr:extracellular solute-binding protein [Clostridia bacterium]
MKATRILALVLAVMMLVGIVPAMADEEPIKISVAGYMFGPVDNEKDVITPAVEKMLKEKHGINVDIEVVYIEQANYAEILGTRLAGGTAPDVFLAQSDTKLNEYYDQGVIKTWDEEFFKTNAPDVYKFITEGAAYGDLINDVDAWKKASMKDGKMVVIPSFKPDGSMPYKTMIYRGDWIENLGYTEETLPKTVDEFVTLMTRFTKEDPDQDGQDNTYGCSLTGMKALFGAYGLGIGFSGSASYWVNKDGTIVNADVTDEAKEVLKILAQMYADGVIDPEFVAGSESVEGSYWAISHGMVTGLYGASANASIDHYRLKGITGPEDQGGRCATEYWAVNGEDSTFVYAPWPAGPNGDYGWEVGTPVAVSESALYNANMSDEKLAVIFQILNAFATDDELYLLAFAGIEGEHYTRNEDGTITRTAGMANEDLNNVGVWGCRSLYGNDRCFSQLGYDLAFYKDVSIANRLNWFKKDQYNSYIQDAVTEVLPSNELFGEMNTVRDEAWTSMIRGEVSVDEAWDAYVADWMVAGGEILTQEANDWYNAR